MLGPGPNKLQGLLAVLAGRSSALGRATRNLGQPSVLAPVFLLRPQQLVPYRLRAVDPGLNVFTIRGEEPCEGSSLN